MKMISNVCMALLLTGLAALSACGPAISPQPVDPETLFAFLNGRQVFQPQLVSPDGSVLVLVWREVEAETSNLYVARTDSFGRFAEPVRINPPDRAPGGLDMDEIRPAVAVGEEGHFAVAWGARDGNVYAAVSRDAARTFGDPIRLNQDEKRAYRGFPAIAFDPSNLLHGIWIDAREAPPRAEEPADLYLAIAGSDGVREVNLTDRQEASICGCCRPSLESFGEELVATFRNTGGGYRDIFQITIGPEGTHSDPVGLAAPMWELEGCPMAGPVSPDRNQALWMEASLGRWRVLASLPGQQYGVVLEEDEDWVPRRPPRSLNRSDAAVTDLLVPGDPYSRRLQRVDGDWKATGEQLPDWATSGVMSGDRLLLVGSRRGQFLVQASYPE